jgi:hypothetical protein
MPLYRLGSRNVKPLQDKILQYICVHPNSTAYDIYRKKVLNNNINDRTIRRQISDLSDKKLVERLQKEDFEHNAKPCKLTIVGISYLILRNRVMSDQIIKAMLKNYGINRLFELFIYPYIKQNTLLQLEDSRLLSQLSLFLYECFKEIEHALYLINNTKSGYLTEEIFAWQRIPDSMFEINSLFNFLKRKFNLNWLDEAKEIKKIKNDKGLLISYKSNSIHIELDDNKTKAILKINRQKKFEFVVNLWTTDSFVISAPVVPIKEYAANSLLLTVRQLIPSFIFNLVSNAVPASSAFQTLSKDEKFLQILEETKQRFDNQYQRLMQ